MENISWHLFELEIQLVVRYSPCDPRAQSLEKAESARCLWAHGDPSLWSEEQGKCPLTVDPWTRAEQRFAIVARGMVIGKDSSGKNQTAKGCSGVMKGWIFVCMMLSL